MSAFLCFAMCIKNVLDLFLVDGGWSPKTKPVCISEIAYSNQLLETAESIYNFAERHRGLYTDSPPLTQSWYYRLVTSYVYLPREIRSLVCFSCEFFFLIICFVICLGSFVSSWKKSFFLPLLMFRSNI